MPHSLEWARYNPKVLETPCPRSSCKAKPKERCRGAVGQLTLAHQPRITAAGYRWDQEHRVLVPLEG